METKETREIGFAFKPEASLDEQQEFISHLESQGFTTTHYPEQKVCVVGNITEVLDLTKILDSSELVLQDLHQ